MFTGLVTTVGRIASVQPLAAGGGVRVDIAVDPAWLDGVALGDSICINGACMTAVDLAPGRFAVDISAESLARTAGLDAVGDLVNLEQSLTLATKLGGHLVSGHVDGVGRVESFDPVGESRRLRLEVPAELARFCAYKGSLTVDGVSLTVNRVADQPGGTTLVDINLIPHTLEHTNLHTLAAGDRVNLEVDLLARYVQRMLEVPASAQGVAEG